MAGITWYPRKFADAVERSHRNKQLLIISVTYSQVNQTEDTILQDTLLNSFDFGDCKVLAVRVELDSVGSNMKVFSESFPDVDSPGIIFVGLNDKAEPKVYDKLPSLCDLSESATPILEEYKANYIKFREANPDFTSDHEEIEPLEEVSLEEKKKSVKEAIARAKAKKAKEEEEEQLKREIQRIKDGKNALDMQEKIKEVNQRREIEKQRMEKEADQKRLRELRELERRDKEERARRKAEAQGTAQPASSTPAPSTVETKPQPIASDDCRICYQFPDGTRVMKVFKSSVNFREVFDAIKDDPHILGSYKLFTTFPRKAIEEYNKNLIELCLTPASVLAVVKIEEMQVVNQGVGYLKNAAMMAFTLVCGPLASLFQFFSLLFGFRVENPTEPSESDKQPKRQQRRSREEKNFKKDGKIQGLNDDDSKSSDEEGTWNGNNTLRGLVGAQTDDRIPTSKIRKKKAAMVKSEFAEEEMLMSGKTSCNEEEDEDMSNEWSQNPNSVSTEERSPLRAASDNSSTGSTGNDGDMLTHNGVNSSSSSAAIDGIPSNRNGSVTPIDDRRMRRQIANCNERRRMQSINAGFQALRSLLPRKDGEKMSKAAILQHTADYIQALQDEKMRLVDENNAIVQCKKRRMGSEYIENMDSSDNSIPVIKQSQGNQTPAVTPVEVMEYLRTIDDLKLALSKEHRLRVIYEREVIEMKTKSMQEANSLGVLRAAAGVQSLLSSQSLTLDSVLHRSDSTSLMMPTPQPSHLPPSATSTDSLLLAASQQVYNNVLFNAAAAVATTPPALVNVTTAQLSPHQHHHHQHTNIITNPSSPYHTSHIHPTTIGDLVISTSSGGISPSTGIIETPVSLNASHQQLAAAVSVASPATLAAITTNPIAVAAAAAAAAAVNADSTLPQQNAQLTQRNLQAIIEAIRHIEGGNMANRVAATSSPSPHSTDLLVR